MNSHTVMRDARMGLTSSTSPLAWAAHTGFVEGIIFTVLASNALTFSLAGSAFVISALSAVAITAVVMGIQYLMMPKPPKPEDGKLAKQQAIPPKIYAIGTNRIAGYHMLLEEHEGDLLSVQAVCGHPISAVNQVWLHDDEVSVTDPPHPDYPDMPTVEEMEDGRYFNQTVSLDWRLGAVPETPYTTIANNLSSSGQWTTNHRGDGQASIAMRCLGVKPGDFTRAFPHAAPAPSIEGDFAKLYDWRDPTQNLNNPGTWKFSKNSILALAWQECLNPYGPKQPFEKAILPVIDYWTEEADICDEMVARAGGGFERRYECNGWATTETDPVAISNAILATCDGHLVRRGDGAIIPTVGKFREGRVAVLTDADIIGHTIQTDYPEEESLNRLVPKFTYPETGYTTTDTDFFESIVDQVRDGRVLSRDASFEWVHSWRQARRLGKREWLRRQEKVHGTFNVRLSGINAVYARWIRLETPVRLPHMNGTIIENRRAVMSLMQGGYQMDWVKHPANIDAWNPAVDEGMVPPIPPKASSSGLPAPTIDSITPIIVGNSVALRVSVVDPGRRLGLVLRYKVQGMPIVTWTEMPILNATSVGGLLVGDTGVVPGNAYLDVQVAFQATAGTLSAWAPATPMVIHTTVDTTPPGAVTNETVTGGVGEATFEWRSPNSPNYVGARIYTNAVNNFSTATLSATEYGAPNADQDVSIPLSAGSYYGWIVSINGSNVEGAPVPVGQFTIT